MFIFELRFETENDVSSDVSFEKPRKKPLPSAFSTLWNASTPLLGREKRFTMTFFSTNGEWLRKQPSHRRGRPFTLRKKRWKPVQSSRPTHLPRDWLGKVVGDSFTLQIGGWNRHQKTFSLAVPLSRVVSFFDCAFPPPRISSGWFLRQAESFVPEICRYSWKKGWVARVIIWEKVLSSDFSMRWISVTEVEGRIFLADLQERVELEDIPGRQSGWFLERWRRWNLLSIRKERTHCVIWIIIITY